MYDLKTAIASIEKNGFYVLKSAFDERTSLALKAELKRISKDFRPPNDGVPFLNSNSELIYNPDHKSKDVLLFILRKILFCIKFSSIFLMILGIEDYPTQSLIIY